MVRSVNDEPELKKKADKVNGSLKIERKKLQSWTVEAVDQPVMISACIQQNSRVYEKIPNQKPDIPEVIPWDNVVLSGHENNCDLFPLGCIGADYNLMVYYTRKFPDKIKNGIPSMKLHLYYTICSLDWVILLAYRKINGYNKNGGILGIPRLKNYREEEVVRQKKLQENAENQREKRAARSQSSAEVETEEESFLRTPPRPTANPPVSASSNLVTTSQSTKPEVDKAVMLIKKRNSPFFNWGSDLWASYNVHQFDELMVINEPSQTAPELPSLRVELAFLMEEYIEEMFMENDPLDFVDFFI